MELSAEALRLAQVDDDPVLELLAAGTLATISLLAGRPRPELMQHALELADACGLPKRGRWPQTFRARQCIWGGRLPEARQHLEALAAEFARSGVEFQRPYRLSDLARLEVASGNLQEAIELARDGTEAAMDAGNMYAAAWMSYPVGLAHAHLGNPAAARDAATTLRSWGEDNDNPPRLLTAAHVLGVLALAAGDGETATAELLPAVALRDRRGLSPPGIRPSPARCRRGDRSGRRRRYVLGTGSRARRPSRRARRAVGRCGCIAGPWTGGLGRGRRRRDRHPRRGGRRLRHARIPDRRRPHAALARSRSAPGGTAPCVGRGPGRGA